MTSVSSDGESKAKQRGSTCMFNQQQLRGSGENRNDCTGIVGILLSSNGRVCLNARSENAFTATVCTVLLMRFPRFL